MRRVQSRTVWIISRANTGLRHLLYYWIWFYICLNHLQGEYWIATHPHRRKTRGHIPTSESSPGRILDCDFPFAVKNHHYYPHCLNHLQGEYWIATNHALRSIKNYPNLVWIISRANTGLRLVPAASSLPVWCLNHLQGEYWIATFRRCLW